MRYYFLKENIPNDGTLRRAIIKAVFGDEPIQGARWEVPGWVEINAGLDAAGINRSMRPSQVTIEDCVKSLEPAELHDVILSLVYTKAQMEDLSPETPGFSQITEGLAKRGIVSEDGQLALRGLPYGDPFEAFKVD